MLARLGAAVAEQVEQLRSVQMQNLVSQAELKALQAQINPHFLFNSLNTLYGAIDRGNAEARRLVLNLADVYRYLLPVSYTHLDVYKRQVPYRAPERELAAVVQAAHPADVCVLKEVGEPEGRACAAFRVLQFLPRAPHD